MKKYFKKIALAATAVAATMALASCGTTGGGDTASKNVTYWVMLSGNASQVVTNLAETPFAQKLMETFDCTIEYQHPAQGQDAEKFNVLVASGKLPDIIEYKWQTNYPGGPQKAIDDGIIYPLDLKKDAPNLKKFIESEQGIALGVDKMIKTDDGQYYGYPFIRGERYLQTSAGIIIREDWLQDLGLEIPETVDEWEIVLKEFKEKKTNGNAPTGNVLKNNQGGFMPAFGIGTDGLYVDNGVVKYGAAEPGYKEWLTLMNDWYKKGYIAADFVSGSNEQAQILNNEIGVTYGACGSGIGKIMAAATEDGFSVTGVKVPVLKKGDRAMYGNYQNAVTGIFGVITNDAQNKELCAKILDYGYCDEGIMLQNFGIEGESYELVDKEGYEGKYPQFTELITANPDGLSMAVSMSRYTNSHTEAPFVQRREYMEQYAQLPQQQAALERWMDTDVADHFMPPVTLTTEQYNEILTDEADLNTYKNEMTNKFIMGQESLDNFDAFVQGLKDRGLEKIVKYNQEAYDRYQTR